MKASKQRKEFEYYCLDRLQCISDYLPIKYKDDGEVKKIIYRFGLKANIKQRPSYILYTETDKDFEQFVYIDVDDYNDYQRHFFMDIISKEEMNELIKKVTTINIYEFVSLFNFIRIYDAFLLLVLNNWDHLNMDQLIEI